MELKVTYTQGNNELTPKSCGVIHTSNLGVSSWLVVRVRSGSAGFQDHHLHDLEGEAESPFLVAAPIGVPSPGPPNGVLSVPQH